MNNYLNIYDMDIKFVKEIRQKHCKGCRNNSTCGNKYFCNNQNVIDCWLRQTYLPEGVYAEACEADAISSMSNHIEKVINKKIVDIIRNK